MSTKTVLLSIAAGLLVAGAGSHVSAQELVQNGGFETGDFTDWTQFGSTADNGVWDGGGMPHSGSWTAYFGPISAPGGIRQTLALTSGMQVQVSFWYLSEGGFVPNSMLATLGSVQLLNLTNITTTSYVQFTQMVTVAEDNPVLSFAFTDPNDYLDMDDVSVQLVGGGCGSADFNCDGDVGTDQDIEAFFACLSGDCPASPCTSSADFNGDGDVGTDQDIEAFFRVLAGGQC